MCLENSLLPRLLGPDALLPLSPVKFLKGCGLWGQEQVDGKDHDNSGGEMMFPS